MKEKLSSLSTILLAFLSSLCWIGPLVFGALGLSGVGFALLANLGQYRIPFAILTLCLLALSYYLVYYRSNGNRANKVILWFSTAVSLGMLVYTFTNRGFWWGEEDKMFKTGRLPLVLLVMLLLMAVFSGCGQTGTDPGSFSASPPVGEVVTVQLQIDGLSWGGCVAALRGAMGSVDGIIEINPNPQGLSTVKYDSGKIDLAGVKKAIRRAGFKVPE